MLAPPVTTVLHRVAAGDRAAVRECLTRYGGLVWSLVRRSTSDAAEAEDVVQEIFVDVWQSASRFDPAVASEATFIAMIARRRLIDRARRRKSRPPTEALQADLPNDAATRPEIGIEAQQAARVLAQLKPDQQKAILLTTCHGLSHEEVAAATGMPLGTVKAHVRRGLMRVREALESTAVTVPLGGGAR